MVSTHAFQLSNNKGKSILLYSVTGLSENLTVNNISYSMPGKTAEKGNINMNLGGFTKLLSFNFILKDGGFDVADGDNIITLKQQWDYIMGDGLSATTGMVQDTGSTNKTTDLQFTIRIYFENSDGTDQFKYYTGALEDISIEPVEGEPFLRGRMTLKIGDNPLKATIT